MTKQQTPSHNQDRKPQTTPGERHGSQRDPRSDTQRMGSGDSQQRQSPGRGDEGRGRDSGGDRR